MKRYLGFKAIEPGGRIAGSPAALQEEEAARTATDRTKSIQQRTDGGTDRSTNRSGLVLVWHAPGGKKETRRKLGERGSERDRPDEFGR
jgi:hypothetical protein